MKPPCTTMVRRCITLTIPIWLILLAQIQGIQAERWSRQVSSSDWIPLANPRASQSQHGQADPGSGLLSTPGSQLSQIQSLTLPPALQEQYQQQLLQLQKTQENIQKLLLLQQQLRTQQQLLQSQTFLPSGFSGPDEEKQPVHQRNLPTVPELGPEILVPPIPSSEALPPVFPPQNFLPQRPPQIHQSQKQPAGLGQGFEGVQSQGQGFKVSEGTLPREQSNVDLASLDVIRDVPRQGPPKRLKEASPEAYTPRPSPLPQTTDDEEEEVQLVYVPAETLAQRGQPKRGRGRKPYALRQQQQQQQQRQQHQQQQQEQHHEGQSIGPTSSSNDEDAFARQLLQQIQMEHEEKAQFIKEERLKEIARINEEQRALERKARLQQEALQREQDLQRQREAEKQKKELERLEEMAKQRELERIRESREKQRMEELERRRLAEARAKEERRREEEERQREAERLAAIERQKELEIQHALKQQQRILERQQEADVKPTGSAAVDNLGDVQALPLIHDQQIHRQHLTEISKSGKAKVRGRQRHRGNQYQEQQSYREVATTPSPNQPPLSVYMGNVSSKTALVRISDVLKILKDAKSIAVLDTVGPGAPQVFVGPTNLEPPHGYAKFDLPYLSSIDHNRVERKVDKLPFFVAPLSFDPPPGYSKIPFPAPHIGSVVVNTLENPEAGRGIEEQNPSPTPLIEPNSYADGLDEINQDSTTPMYDNPTTAIYNQDSASTPKYETTYSTPAPGSSGSRFRFRQFYGDNKPPSVVSTSYYDDQRASTRKHKYYDDSTRATTQSPKVETSIGHSETVSYSSTPSYRDGPTGPEDSSTKEQDLAAQLALINQELNQQGEPHRYHTREQYQQSNSPSPTALSNSFDVSLGDINDVRGPIGPTQYNLPAELPGISPHLPGLVNSLLDKQEAKLQTTTPPTTTTTATTTTTTPPPPSTTYRPRGRQRNRIVPTRPRTTTQASSTRQNLDRSRRPYSRSRSRFTTTTEEYHENVYDPTKSKIPETTIKYNTIEHRRPTVRTQKYRNRDKTSQQSEVHGQNHNVQAHQASAYENLPQGEPGISATAVTYLQQSNPGTTIRQQETILPSSNPNTYPQENYPPTTVTPTKNYPPIRDVPTGHGSPLHQDDYQRNQNYPQTRPHDVRYHGNYPQTTGYEQTALEKTPVNGFNYQAQEDEALEQAILPRPKEYQQYESKHENTDYNLATTEVSRIRPSDDHRYSSVYEVGGQQGQPEYTISGQSNFHRTESEKLAVAEHQEPPIFVPLPQNKQEDFELQISSTEIPLSDVTTETTTTAASPVVLRQRVRGRVASRVQHDTDPMIQTRPRGTHDEYVRFSVASPDPARTNNANRYRDGSRARSRVRTHSHGTQVQTDGNEYIKIHSAHHQRPIGTTTTPTTTTSTSTPRPEVEDVDYGFIRPPSFRPVHPVDNRYHAPVTFRPPLPEIPSQSLLPSEETAVEPDPPQASILKNRPKYQQVPNRRPAGKATTLPTTTSTIQTTTQARKLPVVTTLPDDTVYTARPKSRADEQKPTRTRSRVRRPGKKRVTTSTTTEAVLESHNELPLDENYPRITPHLSTTVDQQSLYDENYGGTPQFSSLRDRPDQYYEPTSENYPPQQFVLNFGNLPEQTAPREEYDQTQLASDPTAKYSQTSRVKPTSDDSQSTVADVYGAESQWSTKLTRTSFQPSFAVNHVPAEKTKSHDWTRDLERDRDAPEIITAGPEVSSVTLVVSSDDRGKSSEADEESMLMGTTMFGRKTNADHTEIANDTAQTTTAPTTMLRDKPGSVAETTYDVEPWLMDRVETSTEERSTIDPVKTTKKADDATPTTKKGGRRRRVRVRVRPAPVDDFVTAESQHINSAVNSLISDHYKYNPVRESKATTAQPATTAPPRKSVLQDFLEEILRNEEMAVPVRATSTTTELPEDAWTMSTAMTTPIVIPEDAEETTLRESQGTTMPTTINLDESMTSTTVVRSSYKRQKYDSRLQESQNVLRESESPRTERTRARKGDTTGEDFSKIATENLNLDDADVRSTVDDAALFGRKYTAKTMMDIKKVRDLTEGAQNAEKLDITTRRVKYSDAEGEMKTYSEIASERENGSSSVRQEKSTKDEDNYTHPKNHRAKWSEVRYPPSALQHSQVAAWKYDAKAAGNSRSTTTTPGLITMNEGETDARTLSDYVKAIFDSMKSAEEDTESPTKTETPDLTNDKEEFQESSTAVDSNTESVDANSQVETTTESTNTMRNTEASEDVGTTTKIDLENVTALDQITTTMAPDTDTGLSVSSDMSLVTDPPTTTMPTARTTGNGVASNSTESILGKVLRTSTTTKVSHMTEICYRGRCVMTRSKRDERAR